MSAERPEELREWRVGRALAVRSSGFRCVLDLDHDLAEELEPDARRLARAAATALTFEVDAGPVDLAEWFARTAHGPGLLALDGIVALSVRVGDRVAAELAGGGDLLQPLWNDGDRLLACDVSWRALVSSRFAVLDEGFGKRMRFWPQVGHALLRRAGKRVINLDVQRAIAAQPRLEVRLALLLWHFASRWGKVERGGIRLQVPLTHQLLGHLVAAERPSVSHALARLAQTGLVTGHSDEWHLHGSLEHQLPAMIEASEERAQHIVSIVSALRA